MNQNQILKEAVTILLTTACTTLIQLAHNMLDEVNTIENVVEKSKRIRKKKEPKP